MSDPPHPPIQPTKTKPATRPKPKAPVNTKRAPTAVRGLSGK